MELNENQRLAVETLDGAIRLVASPGSGKTRVIIERIKNIISKGFSPSQILAVTFTRAAASEMKKRLLKDLPENVVRMMTICTFHALAVRIIREQGHKLGFRPSFSIYDERDSLDVLRQVLKDMNIKQPKAETVFEQIRTPKYTDVYKEYRDRVRGNNAVDFDMLIENALYLLRQPEVMSIYNYKYRFISVDEYQDTTADQHEMTKLLASHWHNICAVADPDQCIYQFTGSHPRFILNFPIDFPGCQTIYLDRCYRCPTNVLSSANFLIKNNRERLDKPCTTTNPDGEIRVLAFDNENEESMWISNKCKELKLQGINYSSIAILSRTNKQKSFLLNSMKNDQIPVNNCGRTEDFFKQTAVSQFLDYLKVVHNPHDAFSFRRIINFPDRGVSFIDILKCESTTRAAGVDCIEGARLYFSDPRHQNDKVVALCTQWPLLLSGTNPSDTAVRAIAALLIEHHITCMLPGREASVKEALLRYSTYDILNPAPELGDFLEYVNELETQEDVKDKADEASEDAVQLMTVHGAKGLEFPVVFIPGLETGVFPISSANKNIDDMEQERRLFYVGITRAEQKLFVTRARWREAWGKGETCEPSLFLDELGQEW